MQCHTAWAQWAVQLLQYNASLPGGIGQCYCVMYCLTARGQWAVQPLQCTASLPRGSGQWNSSNALPHCLGAVGSGGPEMQRLTA